MGKDVKHQGGPEQKGRQYIFKDYRLRIAGVNRDYGMFEGREGLLVIRLFLKKKLGEDFDLVYDSSLASNKNPSILSEQKGLDIYYKKLIHVYHSVSSSIIFLHFIHHLISFFFKFFRGISFFTLWFFYNSKVCLCQYFFCYKSLPSVIYIHC